jgi:hypothetical protein
MVRVDRLDGGHIVVPGVAQDQVVSWHIGLAWRAANKVQP